MPSCRIYPGALGLCYEKTQSAWGAPRLAAARVPLSGPLEREKCWMNGRKTRGRQRGGGGQRESSKWFQGTWPTCRERVSRMLSYTEGLEGIHQLAHWYTLMYKAVLGISPSYLCNFITPNKTETDAPGTVKHFTFCLIILTYKVKIWLPGLT